jgi:hypothetical protein
MKHARSVLLLTLALAASCPPAVAVAEPIGSPPESSASPPGVDVETSDGGAAVLDLGGPLVIKLAGAFAIGVALGMVRTRVRNRRRRLPVAPRRPAAAEPATAEPAASPSTDAGPQTGLAVDDGEPLEDRELEPAVPAAVPLRQAAEPTDASPARERHSELFDAAYAQQVVKLERLREAVRGRVAIGAPLEAMDRGGKSMPAVGVDRGEHRPATEPP